MKNTSDKDKELESRINDLCKKAEKFEYADEREKSAEMRYIVSTIIVVFLIFGHFLVKEAYASSQHNEIRDSVSSALTRNDTLVETFNKTLDSLRAEKSVSRYASYRQDSVKQTFVSTKKQEQKAMFVIDINKADTTELKMIRGIGSVRARGIVKFRELLGGYYSVEQLYEVYSMDSSVVKENLRSFACDKSLIRKIDINHCNPQKIYHPYLYDKNNPQSNALVKVLRKKLYNGVVFKSFEEIEAMPEYIPEKHSRMRHYIEFK